MSPTLAPTSSEPTTAASNVTVEATPIYANRDAEIADTTTPAATTPTTQKKKKFDEAILAQMVEEEKRQSSKLPSYAGITDRYRLIEKMGDGAFSIVYKAHDLVSNEYVAIKIVSKQQLDASELLDFIETDEHYFIVLELVPGGELFHQIVRLTYFSEDLARYVIIQVAEAIKYLHEEAGVVHRDIKPENLLFYPIPFTPSKKRVFRKGDDEAEKQDEGLFIPGKGAGTIGTVKLADFGLSKIIWDQNTKTPCGTVGYTAPEIVNDQRYSKAVDMWALGCVLYTILCGFPPFYDESIQALTEKVARGEFTFLSPWWDDISFEAKDLVNKLLTIDPKRRYNIHQFLAHPWIQKGYEQMNASETAADEVSETQPHDVDVDNSTAFAGHTPGAPGKSKAALNPASIAMREAFDVFSAVHRMKEENNNGIAELGAFAEEDEEEETEALEKGVNNMAISEQSQQPQVPARAPRRRHQQQLQQKAFFELNMDGATLLGRRKKVQVAAN
ncbi:hypothetical protein DV495_004906 [Geotrichum candidum]|nr:hypothetical protein DV454_000866 [Geotrichum candidum]KAI9211646.1 hypothetical protein DS838_003470 [Geotrichum bryndzae]KAF5118389.1 hypothetical protein DV495_004906 [Geotrichum candidum]KAF5119619.1 hypothetical protein DV452_001555 [Geotrichum candidum]KAF7497899.1 hypothetical protein DV113_004077 [Geotrichum candidum]